jgi:hypothetical protein
LALSSKRRRSGIMDLLTGEQLREKYGEFCVLAEKLWLNLDPGKPLLDAERVPESLRLLIPYAELWGMPDDCYREEMIEKAPREAIEELKAVIRQFNDELNKWLAGDESYSPKPSCEYVAFSAMRMAADFA